MKKKIYIPILLATLMFFGCGEDFLERDDLYTISSGTYYSNATEINSGLAAAYSRLSTDGGNNNYTFLANLMSDDCFGGGGPDNIDFQNTDGFTNTLESQYLEAWQTLYQGILRANMVIENIEAVEYENEVDKNQAFGEALFLRAYFHFRLTQFFGQITLRSTSAPTDDVQASYEDIYALIGADLQKAIEILPSEPFPSISIQRNGHATKWAAEGLMARVFLFYTGYHNQSEIVLADGTAITKADVIGWVDDCIANSGHELVTDFRNLWPYASTAADTGEYKYAYAIDNDLEWEGDGNIETVFAVKFSIYGEHAHEFNKSDIFGSYKLHYSNQLVLYSAMRAQEDGTKAFPFGMGWGGAPVNPLLYHSYNAADLRKIGSICNVDDATEGNIAIEGNYEEGKWEFQQETRFTQKKYTPILTNSEKGPKGMYSVMHGEPYNYQTENMQDEVLIRYADVVLMAAELKEDVALLNMTRVRAGVDPLGAYSLDELQKERRHELAFEGVRFYDMLRWGIAEQEFAKVQDIDVSYASVPGKYSSNYRPETRGLLPIPESQIAISNGGLVQNAGW